MLELGVPSERIAVAADLAWLFSPDIADRKWAHDFWRSLGIDVSKPLLGVNVVNERWSGPTEVKAAIAAALDRIIRETGIQVAFLCNETREGEYFDVHAAREVMEMMKEDAVLVPNEYFTPSQMAALLSFCTITLSQRYHFTVLSILADTVPLSFARGQKMTSLLKDLGEEPAGTMEACDPEYLVERIRHVLSSRADIRAHQQSAVKHLEERAKENFKFINLMILNENLLPSLTIASELKSNKFDIRVCRNILVPRFDTFGDIVLLEGFIEAMLDLLPEAHITLLVREGYDQLAVLFPERLIWKTTRIYPYKKPADLEQITSLLEELKKESYDLLLTTTYNHTWPDDLLAAAFTSARRVAIGEERAINDWVVEILPELDLVSPENLYHDYIVVEEKSHETDKYQKLWESITGKTDFIPKPKLAVPEHIYKEAAEFMSKKGLAKETFVFCFPAGTSNISLKTWPADKYAEVIAHLEKKYSLKSLIAAHESEKDIAEKVAALARSRGAAPEIWLGRDGDIPLACALAEQSAFYLGNDTGLMHMAASLGKPVVAIFGGGTWPRFLPCANVGRIFVTSMPCFYCMWDCVLGHPFCMTYLTMEHILPEIENLLLEISHDRKTFKIIETRLEEGHPYLVLARTVGEFIAKEQDAARQTREWAERTEQFLAQERETSRQTREWAERTEQFLVQERETSRQMREWAERTQQLIVAYENEIIPLRVFARRLKWLYNIYLRLGRED